MACWKVRTEEALLLLLFLSGSGLVGDCLGLEGVVIAETAVVLVRYRLRKRAQAVLGVLVRRKERWGLWRLRREEIMGRERIAIGGAEKEEGKGNNQPLALAGWVTWVYPMMNDSGITSVSLPLYD